MSASMNVYACIAAASKDLAETGISKSRNNQQQGYKFRGIDEVMNALAPVLAKHQLVILPRMLTREQTERVTKSGTALFSVVVDAEFDWVSAHDGSKHTTKAFGEAMDSADKATNKAMSAAYKYTAFQTLCIPTEGTAVDADATTPEETVAKAPAGYEQWADDFAATADEGTDALQAMWAKSKIEYRKYLVETNKAGLDALKARAAKMKKQPVSA